MIKQYTREHLVRLLHLWIEERDTNTYKLSKYAQRAIDSLTPLVSSNKKVYMLDNKEMSYD